MRKVLFGMMLGAGLGCTMVQAVEASPHEAGSVCDAMLAEYKAVMGVRRAGVVRIDSNVESDQNLYFGFYGDNIEEAPGVGLAELDPWESKKRKIPSEASDMINEWDK